MDYLLNVKEKWCENHPDDKVLNLIINGLPSKLYMNYPVPYQVLCFKPYYKWITF